MHSFAYEIITILLDNTWDPEPSKTARPRPSNTQNKDDISIPIARTDISSLLPPQPPQKNSSYTHYTVYKKLEAYKQQQKHRESHACVSRSLVKMLRFSLNYSKKDCTSKQYINN